MTSARRNGVGEDDPDQDAVGSLPQPPPDPTQEQGGEQQHATPTTPATSTCGRHGASRQTEDVGQAGKGRQRRYGELRQPALHGARERQGEVQSAREEARELGQEVAPSGGNRRLGLAQACGGPARRLPHRHSAPGGREGAAARGPRAG